MTRNEILRFYDNALLTNNDDEIKRALRLIVDVNSTIAGSESRLFNRQVAEICNKYVAVDGCAFDTGLDAREDH